MQQDDPDITLITQDAPVSVANHGGRAKCLQRLVRLDLPVPVTVALSFDEVHRIATGETPEVARILALLPRNNCYVCARLRKIPTGEGRGRC